MSHASQNAALIAAWVIIGWQVIGSIWELVDEPVTRTFHSNFYLFALFALNIVLTVCALVIII